MRLKTLISLMMFIYSFIPADAAVAEVGWKMDAQLRLDQTPVDMTLSRNGEWFYLITDSGHLLIYSSDGVFNGKIDVGQGFDQIEAGPTEENIYLLNRKGKLVQRIEVSYTRSIDISRSPFKGPEDAPVVIVEYTDFQCPYCARLVSTLDQMMQLYPGKIKIVYKSFPLSSHKYSFKAASAAMAAFEKGKFWEFYNLLFENYNQINDAKIMEFRKKFGFDSPDFDALMNSTQIRSRIAEDREEGAKLGVEGTPTVFINGQRLKNKRPEGFREAIEKELKASDKP